MSCGTGEETVKVEHVMYALCQTSGDGRSRASSARVSIVSDRLRYRRTRARRTANSGAPSHFTGCLSAAGLFSFIR